MTVINPLRLLINSQQSKGCPDYVINYFWMLMRLIGSRKETSISIRKSPVTNVTVIWTLVRKIRIEHLEYQKSLMEIVEGFWAVFESVHGWSGGLYDNWCPAGLSRSTHA